MTTARAYNSHPYAALLMMRGMVSLRSLTWSDLEEFANDIDRDDAEGVWQAERRNAVEAGEKR